jgi:23S rRNA-/tRNA-specific pseudouridylate synthase
MSIVRIICFVYVLCDFPWLYLMYLLFQRFVVRSFLLGAAIGHPIVHDTVYGYNGSAAPYGGLSIEQLPDDYASMKLQRAILDVSMNNTTTTTSNTNTTTRMCVHAKVIQLKHPITGVDMKFTSTPSF